MIVLDQNEYKKLDLNNKILERLAGEQAEKVDKNAEATKDLAVAIKALAEKKTEQPDFSPVIEAIKKTQETQQELYQKLREFSSSKTVTRRKFDFQISRTQYGKIRSVTAIESPIEDTAEGL